MRPNKRDLAERPATPAERPSGREHGPLERARFPCPPVRMNGDGAFLAAANRVQVARHREIIGPRRRDGGYVAPTRGREPANGEGSA